MADRLGLSQSYYGRFERNKGEPNLETLSKLPMILGQSVDFLIGVTDFTQNCQLMKNKFDDASANLSLIKFDLQEIQLNPHSSDIITRDFNPDNPDSIKTKIEFLQKNLPLLEDRMEQARKKLLNMLAEIPHVKESTIEDIMKGDPWGDMLFSDDDE